MGSSKLPILRYTAAHMRTTITHPGADNLVYEIREIVALAHRIEALGQSIVWENIGDPVAKGEQVPTWMKEHVEAALRDNQTYAYSPTMGLPKTREYIARVRNAEGSGEITPDDILFFNGLGDAISNVYRNLHPAARVIGPNPAYPTHSSAEAAHADSPHHTYSLDPENGWQPDLEEMERKLHENPHITGILIVNPDNPTGVVYSPAVMQEIVSLAKQYQCFIISDEIYSNLVYEGTDYQKLATVVEDVPAIAMRGISKEFPWPGGRCGWVEFYNRTLDADFDTFTRSLINAKMLEVCSTTLPQQLIPIIMQDERYLPYLKERTTRYQAMAAVVRETLAEIPELIVHEPQGAFYFTVVFRPETLTPTQSLPIENPEIAALIQSQLTSDTPLDKRFTYYLMASTGLCVVPLMSGFNATYHGFRLTLLAPNLDAFRQNIVQLKEAITQYLHSAT